MDGKTLRGTRIADQERSDHVLSVYDGQSQACWLRKLWTSRKTRL